MHKLLKYIMIILTAFVVSILAIDRVPQLIFIFGLNAGSIYFIRRNTDKEMRAKIIALFLITFLLQVSISLFMYEKTVDTKYYGFSYKGDDYIYGDFGTIVGNLWKRNIFPSMEKLKYYNFTGISSDIHKYQLYNAFVFYLFGACAGQILLIINCFLHAVIIIPVYSICKNLGIRNSVSNFIFALFLFWPSTFYWSLFNFKEPAILFTAFVIFNLLICLRENIHTKGMFFLFPPLFVIYCLKGYLFAIFILIACFYFLFFYHWAYKKITILIFSILFILRQVSAKPLFSNLYIKLSKLPDSLWAIRYSTRFSNTSYFANLLTFTYPTTMLYLPLGFLAVLFLPFLLRPFTLSHIGANIESITWWCLMPFLISGIWISAKTELKKTFPLIFTFFCWLSILALTQTNMGTLIRQKAIIYYIGFIFIGLAIDRGLKGIRTSGDQDIRCKT